MLQVRIPEREVEVVLGSRAQDPVFWGAVSQGEVLGIRAHFMPIWGAMRTFFRV